MSETTDKPPGAPPATSSETENGLGEAPQRRPLGQRPKDDRAIPEAVREKFRVEGNQYLFSDGVLAFTDRGRRLTTRSENREVIRSLVTIASARGWEAVTVSGTERFRREAWGEAVALGMDVRGYAPNAEDRERLAQRQVAIADARAVAERDAAMTNKRDGHSRAKDAREPIAGRLLGHGEAPYQQKGGNPLSYFVTVETERGPRTVWGVDLRRALRESETQPQVGDAVELRSISKALVTVKTGEHSATGDESAESKTTFRNRWLVEMAGFLAARAAAAESLRNEAVSPQAAVERHPSLAGSYAYLKLAEDLAAKQLDSKPDQMRFVASVRVALAESVERGEPWVRARMLDRSPQQRRQRELTQNLSR